MIEILGAVTGFAGSLIAPVFKHLQDRADRKHELAVMQLQIQAQKDGHIQKLEEINAAADISESKALYKTFYSGIRWIDALNGSVRPVIAYSFFGLYAWTKIAYVLKAESFIMERLWTSTDNAIFLTIISFFYGQRAMQKIMKK